MATRKTDYTNEAQQRLMRLVLVLFGDVVNGYSPSVIAKAMNCKPPIVTRDLDNLATAGIAERDESGAWRLTARLPQQAIKVFTAIDRAERRIEEAKNRFNRNPD
ncbi:MAG: IclR family transcriptional regulator [Rhodoferax sp.]